MRTDDWHSINRLASVQAEWIGDASMSAGKQATPSDLASLAGAAGDAVRVAAIAGATWRDVHAVLAPIVGQRGADALYKRSLYLTRADHPCLAEVYDSELRPGEFTALQAMLAQQPSVEAALAHHELLQTFLRLLNELVGASLTKRLLGSLFANPSSGAVAKDTPT